MSQHAFYESRTAGGPDLVDTKDLKVLARKMLPEDSPLRRLILSEKDTMPYSEWLGKMEIFGRLLDQETIVISPGGQ